VEVNRSGKCEGSGGGDRRGALCTRFTLVKYNYKKMVLEGKISWVTNLHLGQWHLGYANVIEIRKFTWMKISFQWSSQLVMKYLKKMPSWVKTHYVWWTKSVVANITFKNMCLNFHQSNIKRVFHKVVQNPKNKINKKNYIFYWY
jgi:hypothetical protein